MSIPRCPIRPDTTTFEAPERTRGVSCRSVPERQSTISFGQCATSPWMSTPSNAPAYSARLRCPARNAGPLPPVSAAKLPRSTGITRISSRTPRSIHIVPSSVDRTDKIRDVRYAWGMPAQKATAPSPREDVQQQVIDWRHHVLAEAGYTDEIARAIAESDADLHRAVELLRLGCEPEVAARILV